MGVAPPPSRRDELSAFLRSRRARIHPADVGLPDDGSRRRTPGLRREELAQLAGVGVSWYTWLEQGRDINASPQVLDALSRALRLQPAERATLFALARTELPLPDGEQPAGAVSDLAELVDALHPHPAYLLGPLTRLLAWNRAATAFFGDFGAMPEDRRSLLWWLFADDETTRSLGATPRNTLLRFRADFARHAGEEDYEREIARLRAHSELFARWWDEHDVADTQRGVKTVEHPRLGPLRLLHAQTIPTGAPELRLAVYAPGDERTRDVFASL